MTSRLICILGMVALAACNATDTVDPTGQSVRRSMDELSVTAPVVEVGPLSIPPCEPAIIAGRGPNQAIENHAPQVLERICFR